MDIVKIRMAYPRALIPAVYGIDGLGQHALLHLSMQQVLTHIRSYPILFTC